VLNERLLRCWAAVEARDLGRGGVSVVAHALRMSRSTIYNGLGELPAKPGPVRRPGGGRSRQPRDDPQRFAPLDKLLEPQARGAAKSPLRWSVKSTEQLAGELTRRGHPASARHVAALLIEAGFRLEGRRKPRTDGADRARNEQLKGLNRDVRRHLARKQPAIFLDLKTKRNSGNYGPWTPARLARRSGRAKADLRVFAERAVPKDLRADVLRTGAWATMVFKPEAAELAADSVRQWWKRIGRRRYRRARELLIAIDAGSERQRSRLWAKPLEQLNDELGVKISVRHFPAATTRWSRVDCRQFNIIVKSEHGRPVARHQAIVSLIGHP
jgi:Rhodopirellula transposase DDE domain